MIFDLKQTLLEDESEKEKLTQYVLKLRGDLEKKEAVFVSFEKKLKDRNPELMENKFHSLYFYCKLQIKPHRRENLTIKLF